MLHNKNEIHENCQQFSVRSHGDLEKKMEL